MPQKLKFLMNVVNMTLNKKITTLKNLIGMRQMTLNDPKFDLKISLNTQRYLNEIFDFVPRY